MKNLKTIILLATVVAIGIGLRWWWQHEKLYPSTDDAYIRANILNITPQINGRVTRVAVSENDYIQAGDLLVQLDTAPMEAALQAAKAQYEIAQQNVGAAASNVLVAMARLVSAKAALTQAEVSFDRTQKLFQQRDVAAAVLDQVRTARDAAQADVAAAEAAVAAAKSQAGTAGGSNAAIQAALANLTMAQINLGYSRITAPVSGWVSNVTLQPGTIVMPGSPLFALVEDGNWWIEANFKETDLARIRPTQNVSVNVDMYPGLKLKGKVQSLGAGSGAVFSLLPPQNASGNWVKVTQRFPVRIALDQPPKDTAMPLRVGASVSVKVDTAGADNSK